MNEMLDLLRAAEAPYKWRNNLERVLKRLTNVIEPPDFTGISRDPKDDPVIAAALVGDCDYIITSDKDLLELGGSQTMKIVTPAEFLKLPHGGFKVRQS